MRFLDRTALVTGAGGPMGFAIADRLLSDGVSSLALTDISGTRLSQSVSKLQTKYPSVNIIAIRSDVTIATEVKEFIHLVEIAFGTVDLLVNLVGGIRSKQLYTLFLDMTEQQWLETLNLNLLGSFHLIQAFAPNMLKQEFGRIVNVTSIVFGGEAGQSDYAAAKAAVASLTCSLAAEFAPHVTVNCVAPGLTRTSVTENMSTTNQKQLLNKAFNQRMAEPKEIADAIAFLLAEDSCFITGEIISVSGGIHPHL